VNKNKSKNLKGIVVALKANFLIVEIDYKDLKQKYWINFLEKLDFFVHEEVS